MAKLIKILVLLAIVVGAGVAIYSYSKQPTAEPAPPEATLKSGDKKEAPPRVEEKYGFTSEGVGGG